MSFASRLSGCGIRFESFTTLATTFWKSCAGHGEPDLLLRFTGPEVRPLVVLVEVKLNSEKSGTGPNDQLARYLALLDDRSALPDWDCPEDHRFLVYLTRDFATTELEESVAASTAAEAAQRMFGLEWRDVLEAAENEGSEHVLLSEVATFLKGRGFEAFHGFRERVPLGMVPEGCFYATAYFRSPESSQWADVNSGGQFYGNELR